MKPSIHIITRWIGGSAILLLSTAAMATPVTYDNVTFPDGDVSFADAVVSYNPALGGIPPATQYQDDSEALGAPDVSGGSGFVSLGAGGQIVLRFTDNSLTGSGDAADDLWIFEIGPDIEDTTVDISKDGVNWFSVGSVGGSTAGIDIDDFGFDATDFFSYVRLTDVYGEGNTSGASVGADIDAVGAISSAAPVSVPAPSVIWLFGVGLGLLGLGVGLRRRQHGDSGFAA